jgi:hypothetical protein
MTAACSHHLDMISSYVCQALRLGQPYVDTQLNSSQVMWTTLKANLKPVKILHLLYHT